ncbi:rCG54856 [Rattus norvegicus]|uniref:RCG54856 n=1 Tax=Rattus norvegicus TaxID=10116 RepID=A6IIQ3_RAT|nr:rCG54856 [Rattus norvegicus]
MLTYLHLFSLNYFLDSYVTLHMLFCFFQLLFWNYGQF